MFSSASVIHFIAERNEAYRIGIFRAIRGEVGRLARRPRFPNDNIFVNSPHYTFATLKLS